MIKIIWYIFLKEYKKTFKKQILLNGLFRQSGRLWLFRSEDYALYLLKKQRKSLSWKVLRSRIPKSEPSLNNLSSKLLFLLQMVRLLGKKGEAKNKWGSQKPSKSATKYKSRESRLCLSTCTILLFFSMHRLN